MLPTASATPLDSPDYGYEVRWGGLRLLAGLEGRQLHLRSGAGHDPSFWFPELSAIRAAAEPEWVLLDGELVVLDGGRVAPELLQRRLRAADAAAVARLALETPATLMLYDILRIGDSWLLDVSWDERRGILARALAPNRCVAPAPSFRAGKDALGQARRLALEAVLGKRLRGRYYPGQRTRDWLSIKPLEVVEAVICGWTEGRGARGGTVGTLLLGLYRDECLVCVGRTGTGIDADTLRFLHHALSRGAQGNCPFGEYPVLTGHPNWVQPEFVCRVRHQGWTNGGKMRSPTFLGMAAERRPSDCLLPEDVTRR